jgi:hypothetical protein
MSRKKIKSNVKFPAATIALYGPNDQVATKLVATIVKNARGTLGEMRKWFSESDVKDDEEIQNELKEFLFENGVKNVVTPDRIIGCPHEEGIDYPEGESCPECAFWAGRNRWTGNMEH